MILHNPTKSDVSITISGDRFVIEAESNLTVSDSVGDKWLKVHEFLQVASKVEPKAAPKAEVKEGVKPEDKKEVKEEVK